MDCKDLPTVSCRSISWEWALGETLTVSCDRWAHVAGHPESVLRVGPQWLCVCVDVGRPSRKTRRTHTTTGILIGFALATVPAATLQDVRSTASPNG